MEKTFKVTNLEAFIVNLNDVTKKAKKLGFESPEYSVVEKIENSTKLYEVTVTYEIPYIKGWKVIAKREKSNDIVITHSFDDSDLSEYKDIVKCDHCGTGHKRKKSYVIKNLETGNTLEVGHACLKDFIPVNPDALLKVCEFLQKDYEEKNGKCVYVYDVKKILAITHAVVSNHGYVSVKTSEEKYIPATKNTVLYHLEKGGIELTETNYEYADRIVAYFNNLNESEYVDNSYITNCIKLLKRDYVEGDFIGYVISSITVYHKATEQVEKNVGCYVGNIGEKISVKAKLVDRKIVNGYYGDSQLFKFVGVDNNNYVTFYSGCKYGDNEIGKVFTLTGTLSKHESYKDVKNNVLKRISLK